MRLFLRNETKDVNTLLLQRFFNSRKVGAVANASNVLVVKDNTVTNKTVVVANSSVSAQVAVTIQIGTGFTLTSSVAGAQTFYFVKQESD